MTCATSWPRVRKATPGAPIVVGGHSAAAYPAPFFEDGVDAICLDDGERAVPALVDALARGTAARRRAGLAAAARLDLAADARARDAVLRSTTCRCRRGICVSGWRHRYACLHHRPAVPDRNGARLSVPLLVLLGLAAVRSVRPRAIDRRASARTSTTTGDQIFVADDLFWHHPSRSRALADALVGKRPAQGLDPRPDARGCRRPAPRAARGLAADRPRVRHLLRARSRDRHRPREPQQGHDGRSDRGGARGRARARLRRHRQLRDRSRLDGGGLRAPLGLRRDATSSRAPASRS